jgi:hypothetical protein
LVLVGHLHECMFDLWSFWLMSIILQIMKNVLIIVNSILIRRFQLIYIELKYLFSRFQLTYHSDQLIAINWALSKKLTQCRSLVPGVDVMITIFCDFQPFFCEKIGVFLKTNVMIHFLQDSAGFWEKNVRKYFNNHNIGPSSARTVHSSPL